MLLVVSWATLFIRQEAINVRCIMALTTLLVLYTLFANMSQSLPSTAAIKLIDIWFFFIIFVLFTNIMIHVFMDDKTPRTTAAASVSSTTGESLHQGGHCDSRGGASVTTSAAASLRQVPEAIGLPHQAKHRERLQEETESEHTPHHHQKNLPSLEATASPGPVFPVCSPRHGPLEGQKSHYRELSNSRINLINLYVHNARVRRGGAGLSEAGRRGAGWGGAGRLNGT
ncbi:hypothetical protein O3P69_000108 [Scylla paramamosain]|uniref:Neurotransmitter-gated ion-channel transmembrane domain-containing protein n=1 Tax=Scylla paramamosain TaxID=85552 RepID=A0AAW0UX68_SCYPA